MNKLLGILLWMSCCALLAIKSPSQRGSLRRRLSSAATFLGVFILVWGASLLLHELGHGLTAQILGGRFTRLTVWPGIQVWPHFGQPNEEGWGTALASIAYTLGQNWTWQDALVGVMGSGFNLILAALALGCLWRFRPRGWLRTLLIAQSLMFFDLLTYVLVPEFLGLPHYFILGGGLPEPTDNAELLGCPRWAFIALTLFLSAAMTGGLVAYLRSETARIHPLESS